MIRNLRWAVIFMGVYLAAVLYVTVADGAGDAPRMTKETLKARMEAPDLIILDVRRGKDWDASEFKIKGAIRVDPGKFDAWKNSFSKDKTLVLYCA